MKERPILFSAPMVRAILEGRKTQTRRVIKPQPTVSEQRLRELGAWADDYTLSEQVNAAFQAGCIDAHCPYGRPGDRLWVQETWLPRAAGSAALYRADYGEVEASGIAGMYSDAGRWRSPIHMPRWASRITLEITGVRVERLQEISAEDARAEGVIPFPADHLPAAWTGSFERLWESINGPGTWNANPWVWVIEFKRIDAQQVAA